MSAPITRYALTAATIVVVVVLGLSLAVIDSPSEAREKRIDARRVHLLNEISSAIDVYFGRHRRLPADLSALRDVSSVDVRDPVTGDSFGYAVKGEKAYELCAVFSREPSGPERAGFWWHPAGRQCYTLNVRETGH